MAELPNCVLTGQNYPTDENGIQGVLAAVLACLEKQHQYLDAFGHSTHVAGLWPAIAYLVQVSSKDGYSIDSNLCAVHFINHIAKSTTGDIKICQTPLKEENENLKRELKRALNDVSLLEEQVSSLQSSIDEKDSEHSAVCKNYEDQICRLVQQISAKDEELLDVQSLLENTQKLRDLYAAQLQEADIILTWKNMLLQANTADLDAKTADFEATRGQLAAKTADFEAIRQQLAEKTAELGASSQQLAEKTADLDAKTADFEAIRGQLESKTAELAEKTAELAEKTADFEAIRQQLEVSSQQLEVSSQQPESSSHGSSNEDLGSKIAELNTTVLQLEAANEELQGKIKELQDLNVSLEAKIQELETENGVILEGNEELQITNEELRGHMQEAKETNETLEATIITLEVEKEMLAHDKEELEAANKKLATDLDDYKTYSTTILEENYQLKFGEGEYENAMSAYEKTVAELEKEQGVLKNHLLSMSAGEKQKIKLMDSQLKDAKDELAKTLQKYSASSAELARVEAELAESQKNLAKAKEENKVLQVEFRKQGAELISANSLNAEMQRCIDSCNSRVSSSSSDVSISSDVSASSEVAASSLHAKDPKEVKEMLIELFALLCTIGLQANIYITGARQRINNIQTLLLSCVDILMGEKAAKFADKLFVKTCFIDKHPETLRSDPPQVHLLQNLLGSFVFDPFKEQLFKEICAHSEFIVSSYGLHAKGTCMFTLCQGQNCGCTHKCEAMPDAGMEQKIATLMAKGNIFEGIVSSECHGFELSELKLHKNPKRQDTPPPAKRSLFPWQK